MKGKRISKFLNLSRLATQTSVTREAASVRRKWKFSGNSLLAEALRVNSEDDLGNDSCNKLKELMQALGLAVLERVAT